MNVVFTRIFKPFNTISLQRKLLLFIVVTLSFIFTSSSILMYKLANETFMESEKRHIVILSESLSSKVGIWYFINKESHTLHMDEFLTTMLTSYHLEYIAFKDKNGLILSEVKSPLYAIDDPYNLEYEKVIYSPENIGSKNKIGILKIGYGQHILKTLSRKYYIAGTLLITLLAIYFYLEMQLLKELLTPLRKIAAEIKGYLPGKKLSFDSFHGNKEDVIAEIVNGFLHMQQNINDAIKQKEIEEESNKAKDAILVKQSRFIEMGTMLNNIAHQWKQPLNIIELCITNLTVKSMLGTIEKTYQQKLFDDMHMQIEFMSKTLDIFKNFLNDEVNKKEREIFSIKQAIEDSMKLLSSTLETEKIAVELTLDETSSAYGSISEVEQVILIIINNAIDAGSDKIVIECVVDNQTNIVKILDNGGGFDLTIIDKIFDAYFTTKHQSQGTGLGLFIAKMIIEMKFNGTIEAQNYQDGALFTIKLPFHVQRNYL